MHIHKGLQRRKTTMEKTSHKELFYMVYLTFVLKRESETPMAGSFVYVKALECIIFWIYKIFYSSINDTWFCASYFILLLSTLQTVILSLKLLGKTTLYWVSFIEEWTIDYLNVQNLSIGNSFVICSSNFSLCIVTLEDSIKGCLFYKKENLIWHAFVCNANKQQTYSFIIETFM